MPDGLFRAAGRAARTVEHSAEEAARAVGRGVEELGEDITEAERRAEELVERGVAGIGAPRRREPIPIRSVPFETIDGEEVELPEKWQHAMEAAGYAEPTKPGEPIKDVLERMRLHQPGAGRRAAKEFAKLATRAPALGLSIGFRRYMQAYEQIQRQEDHPMKYYKSLFDRGIDEEMATERHDVFSDAVLRDMSPRHTFNAPDRFGEGLDRSYANIQRQSNGGRDVFSYLDRLDEKRRAHEATRANNHVDPFERAMAEFDRRQNQYFNKRNAYNKYRR